jgi:hypothetical protein
MKPHLETKAEQIEAFNVYSESILLLHMLNSATRCLKLNEPELLQVILLIFLLQNIRW